MFHNSITFLSHTFWIWILALFWRFSTQADPRGCCKRYELKGWVHRRVLVISWKLASLNIPKVVLITRCYFVSPLRLPRYLEAILESITMNSFSFAPVLLFLLWTLEVHGGLIYDLPSSNCTYTISSSTSVSCCNGACLDGTFNFQPGLCQHFDDPCNDIAGPPQCANNQVITNFPWVEVDSGDGCCYECN